MSDIAAKPDAFVTDIFLEFLLIGATSFGGVVPYLRNSLVTKRHWVDDKEFVELLSIPLELVSQRCAEAVGELLRHGFKGPIQTIAIVEVIRKASGRITEGNSIQ